MAGVEKALKTSDNGELSVLLKMKLGQFKPSVKELVAGRGHRPPGLAGKASRSQPAKEERETGR